MNSRSKGARGERELAKVLRGFGYDCRRGQQYSGANGDADVVGLPGIHIECKRRERLDLYSAIAQSTHDAKKGEMPTVMHRKNDCAWLVTMTLDSFMEMYKRAEDAEEEARLLRKELKKLRKAETPISARRKHKVETPGES